LTGYSKAHVPVVPFCLTVPVINPTTCPIISQESYKAILIGDINGNFATVGSGGLYRMNDNTAVIFDLAKAKSSNGFIDVPISVVSDVTVNALDFALQADVNNLSYHSLVDHSGYLQSLSNFSSDDNTLRYTSYSLQNYDLGTPLVSVRFASHSGSISENDLHSAEAYLNGEKVPVQFSGRSSMTPSAAESHVIIYPNPASSVLNIVSAVDAYAELTDMNGRQILLQVDLNSNERKEINTSSLAPGIYMLKVSNADFIKIEKVVITR
jgi:hypothetical protein